MDSIELGIQCSTDVADQLGADLMASSGEQVDQLELNNLDGSAPVVLQVVQIATSLVSVVAPILGAYIGRNKVKKVKLGSIEIENPTREQWEYLWNAYLSSKQTDGAGASDA